MPRDERFWNPYRFVPVRQEVNRERPITGERFAENGLSGNISCTLTNLTPLFIGTNAIGDQRPFLASMCDRKPLIPGSSLKGMLRSLAELVGGGCSVIPNRNHTPTFMTPCNDNSRLCITCRMFGMMGRGHNAKVLKGKVSFGEASLVDGDGRTKPMDVYLGGPKTTHAAFYISPDTGRVDGRIRKLYFHQPIRQDALLAPFGKAAESQWQIQALPKGHVFSFQVQFQNLTEEELSLLLYVLSLEEQVEVEVSSEKGEVIRLTGPMRHKLGYAKPLGGGSCQIHVTQLAILFPPSQRFATMAGSGETVFEEDALSQEIRSRTDGFRRDTSATMQRLRTMMVWDKNDPRDFRYPGCDWFRADGNGQTPLKPI